MSNYWVVRRAGNGETSRTATITGGVDEGPRSVELTVLLKYFQYRCDTLAGVTQALSFNSVLLTDLFNLNLKHRI